MTSSSLQLVSSCQSIEETGRRVASMPTGTPGQQSALSSYAQAQAAQPRFRYDSTERLLSTETQPQNRRPYNNLGRKETKPKFKGRHARNHQNRKKLRGPAPTSSRVSVSEPLCATCETKGPTTLAGRRGLCREIISRLDRVLRRVLVSRKWLTTHLGTTYPT
jgi:hypothetical protein